MVLALKKHAFYWEDKRLRKQLQHNSKFCERVGTEWSCQLRLHKGLLECEVQAAN